MMLIGTHQRTLSSLPLHGVGTTTTVTTVYRAKFCAFESGRVELAFNLRRTFPQRSRDMVRSPSWPGAEPRNYAQEG